MMPEKRNTLSANTKYMSLGIAIIPAFPSAGEMAKIVYDGILSKGGAIGVIAHVGFGSTWKDGCEYAMNKTDMGFEVQVPVKQGDSINICFKDSAGNWDNNSGVNYSFDVM